MVCPFNTAEPDTLKCEIKQKNVLKKISKTDWNSGFNSDSWHKSSDFRVQISKYIRFQGGEVACQKNSNTKCSLKGQCHVAVVQNPFKTI